MRRRARRCAAVLLCALAAGGERRAGAQPVTERSPNIEGTWVTSPRNLAFAFSHRFQVVGGDVDVSDIFGDGKIVNYPTFQLTYGLLDGVNLGFRYSSNSTLAGGPNEWQPYVKWSPLRGSGGSNLALSGTAAWNGAAQSVDGEIAGQVRLGPLSLLGAVRGFSDAFEAGTETSEPSLAVAGGALFRLTRHLALAADVADRVAGASGSTAWSAGLQIGIPYTPHTFSLLATNVTSGTLQGVSAGAPGVVYWGFEFTVPFSGFARWGDIFDPRDASGTGPSTPSPPAAPRPGDEEPVPPGDVQPRRVVEVEIAGFRYERADLRIPAGTTVRWINRDPVGHTVTADDGGWASALIGPGEVFEHTFAVPGEFSYHCVPHPYMKARLVVLESRSSGAGGPGGPGAGDAPEVPSAPHAPGGSGAGDAPATPDSLEGA